MVGILKNMKILIGNFWSQFQNFEFLTWNSNVSGEYSPGYQISRVYDLKSVNNYNRSNLHFSLVLYIQKVSKNPKHLTQNTSILTLLIGKSRSYTGCFI